MPITSNSTHDSTAHAAGDLCHHCGLCCTGLLFRHVRLGSSDKSFMETYEVQARESSSDGTVMRLPCSFRDGTSCRVYADRPRKCRSYSCILRRQVSNGSTGIAQARGIVDDLKILIHLMDPVLRNITGSGFYEMNFRDFCRRFAREARQRIADGTGLNEAEQQLIPIAFEVIKIIDRDFRETGRLDDFEDLLLAQDRWNPAGASV